MFLVLASSAKLGLKGGVCSGIGNAIAAAVQTTIALLVVYKIGDVSKILLEYVRLLGAAYIIHIGISIFSVKSFGPASASTQSENSYVGQVKQGFLFAIANPKAIIFFASIFPQFIKGTEFNFLLGLLIYIPVVAVGFLATLIYAYGGIGIMKIMGNSSLVPKIFGLCIIFSGAAMLLNVF
jgi:homoserine/homoserine lactone efflux protein